MRSHLCRETLSEINSLQNISVPGDTIFKLPEKVLQFGTGVLLRGLPDYFINKANMLGIFNGRIVVVKSTSGGDAGSFTRQDNLYSHCILGTKNGENVSEYVINASISRVLAASSQWEDILECAANPDMQIVISNTTEVGIKLVNEKIETGVPASFPGKLLSFLYRRYVLFNGDPLKGLVIVPTELITDNGSKLYTIIRELALLNGLEDRFIEWLQHHNLFCNSLVDRIIPNAISSARRHEIENVFQCKDELMITSEWYKLWAIEAKDKKVKEILSFANVDESVVISDDIETFRELKLRLLNGSHTFNCSLAHLAGFETVRQAMNNTDFSTYVEGLMLDEISPAIVNSNISCQQKENFSLQVLERFRNPFIDQRWLSIALHYTSKMQARNIPLILNYYSKYDQVPVHMALGFASYLLFMKGKQVEGRYYGQSNGISYLIEDEYAGYFAGLWTRLEANELVTTVLGNIELWGSDLNKLNGFGSSITMHLYELLKGNVFQIIYRIVEKNKRFENVK